MPAPKKELKLFRVEIDESTYYVTAADAHDAYSDVVVHEETEGHHAHREALSFSVCVEEVDPVSEKFLAWRCG